MTIATVVSILRLATYSNPFIVSSSVTLMSSSFAASVSSSVVQSTRLSSMGWYSQSNTLNFFDNSSLFVSPMGVTTASWPGIANSFGTFEMMQTSSLVSASFQGTAANWGQFYQLPETRNTNPITSDNTESDQSFTLVDWNFFPTQTVPTIVDTKGRDATRYQKAYSFSRSQPVRIRVFRQ